MNTTLKESARIINMPYRTLLKWKKEDKPLYYYIASLSPRVLEKKLTLALNKVSELEQNLYKLDKKLLESLNIPFTTLQTWKKREKNNYRFKLFLLVVDNIKSINQEKSLIVLKSKYANFIWKVYNENNGFVVKFSFALEELNRTLETNHKYVAYMIRSLKRGAKEIEANSKLDLNIKIFEKNQEICILFND